MANTKASVLTAEDALDIYVRVRAGENQADIAKDHVISQQTVSGIKLGCYWNQVTGHEYCQLTALQERVRDIYSAYWEQKQPVSDIADFFGVSLSTVYRIRNGSTGARFTGHPNPKIRTRKVK